MDKATKTAIREQWRRLPNSTFIDLQIIALLVLLGGISFFLNPGVTLTVSAVGFVLTLAHYLRDSARVMRAPGENSSDTLDGAALRMRVADGYAWHLRSVFFRPVIFKKDDGLHTLHRLVHEIGHIRSRDHLFYVLIKPFLVVVLFAYLLTLIHNAIFLSGWNYGALDDDVFWPIVSTVAMLYFVLFLVPFAIIALLSIAPREREYLADHFAHRVIGDDYKDYLLDEDEFATSRKFKSRWAERYHRFTHPSFLRRLEGIDRKPFKLAQASVVSGVLAGSNLLFLELFLQFGHNNIETDTIYLFQPRSDAFLQSLSFNAALLLIFVISLAYSASVIAFAVQLNTLPQAFMKLIKFILGASLVYVFASYPRYDMLDPELGSLWLKNFANIALSNAGLFLTIFCIWSVAKRSKGHIDDFTIWGNISACFLAFLIWLGFDYVLSSLGMAQLF